MYKLFLNNGVQIGLDKVNTVPLEVGILCSLWTLIRSSWTLFVLGGRCSVRCGCCLFRSLWTLSIRRGRCLFAVYNARWVEMLSVAEKLRGHVSFLLKNCFIFSTAW